MKSTAELIHLYTWLDASPHGHGFTSESLTWKGKRHAQLEREK